MYSSRNRSVNDQYRERDVVPLMAKERQAGGDAGWSGPARDLDPPGKRRSRIQWGDRPPAPSPHAAVEADEVASPPRRSLARRAGRALIRFAIAVAIGIGGTLGWQTHGEQLREMAKIWAPSLVWLLPVATTDSPAPASAATSAELVQQIAPVARDLALVRRGVEELAARQEQMAQSIATLQAVEQDLRLKTMAPQPPAAPAPAPAAAPPQRRPAQPAGQSGASVAPTPLAPPAAPKPPLVLR
jgi:hypothetical protein